MASVPPTSRHFSKEKDYCLNLSDIFNAAVGVFVEILTVVGAGSTIFCDSMLVAAGARTDLRDSNGLTVFDILEQELRRWSAPALPAVFVESVRMQHDALLKALQS